MDRSEREEVRRVLSVAASEKPDETAPVRIQLSILNFLRRRGKVSPQIREAVLEKLRRMVDGE